MSSALHLPLAVRRRLFVCADCRRWVAEQSSRQQRRGISRNGIRKIKIAEAEWAERRDAIEKGKAQSVLEHLEERGLVNQVVGNRDELNKVLVERRVGVYCGVDPTAPSLHIGHMVPFMALGWMFVYGYSATYLLGGFTASIGDPTDRLTAREEQATATRKRNVMSMFEQLKRLAAGIEKYAVRRGMQREWAWRRAVKNNQEWWVKMTVSEYMKKLGRSTRMGPLLGRDSVKNRMEKGEGMSYAEFSYPLMQAWDWWHQFQGGTQIQIGGADQFGNILAGTEAVKAIMQNDEAFRLKYKADLKGQTSSGDPMGFTVPLLTTSAGEKFGKSAGNAIWIDPQLTSSFDLYQFFLRAADDDVERYLKMLTFLPLHEIHSVIEEHLVDPSKRIAQRKLADEFVELVHGLGAAQKARDQHNQVFSKTLSIEEIKAQAAEQARVQAASTSSHPLIDKRAKPLDAESSTDVNIKLPRSLVYQQPLNRILHSAGLVASRSDGQRLINNGGVYVAGQSHKDGTAKAASDAISYAPATSPKWSFIEPLIVDGNLLILRVGKWKKKFITIVSDEEYKESGLTCPGWSDGEPAEDAASSAEEERQRMLGAERQKSATQKKQERRSRQSQGFGQVTNARFAE